MPEQNDSMSLYDLTVAAESTVSNYKNPNLAEWISAINPVLKEAGKGDIGGEVDEISFSGDEVTIYTLQTILGYVGHNSITIPISILKDPNPVTAATRYRLDRELAEAVRGLAEAQQRLKYYSGKVDELGANLRALRKGGE